MTNLRERTREILVVNGSPVSEYAVETRGLTKSFNGHLVLRGIDLTVREREFLTILGPNGAGKTTLLRILATLTRPSSGDVTVAGLKPGKDSTGIRRRIGYVPHQTLLYDDLTAHENLKFYGRMYDVVNPEQRIQTLTERADLSPHLHKQVRTLSRGIQQRFSIMRALLHEPPVLLLDEPDTGLDQHSRAKLGELLDTGSRTVIMSSHRLESCLELGDRVIILASGKITYNESTESLGASDLANVYARCTEER
jgi:heme exporter protein A